MPSPGSIIQLSFSMTSTVQTAKDFLTLQEERARKYHYLSQAHKDYLTSGPNYDFTTYRTKVNEATNTFKTISEGVLKLQTRLQTEYELPRLAAIVAKVQELEELKLKFTVDHQLALQQAKESPEDELLDRNAKGLKKELDSIMERISDCIGEYREELFDLEDEGAEK